MFHVKHAPDFAQLVENIREHGPILPVYYFEGRVLDGSRRALACFETGKAFVRVVIRDREQAARLLWSLHPDRALAEFGRGLSVADAAQLLGASPSAVILARRQPRRRGYPPPSGLKLRAMLSPALAPSWRVLLVEHRCTVSEAINALVSALAHDEVRSRFAYYLTRDRKKKRPYKRRTASAST